MATAAVPNSVSIASLSRKDRIFYSTIAIVLALTVLIGFAPTYYLRVLGSEPMRTISGSPFTSLVHLHGLLFSAWVGLFVIQTALVARHRVNTHRRLGIAGGMLAALMVIVGIATALQGAARGSSPPGVDPLAFLVVPMFDMFLFATFIMAALWMRKNKEAHKRLMLLAYIGIIVAAVARFPGVLPLGPLVFFGLAFIFLLVGVSYDLYTRRCVHPVYVWGGLLLVVSVPLRLAISSTTAWRSTAEFLVGFAR
jgi:hypothetical protein